MAKIKIWVKPEVCDSLDQKTVQALVFGDFNVSNLTVDKEVLKVECDVADCQMDALCDYLEVNSIVEAFIEDEKPNA